METIKNYLESMFRNLPNTAEVLKAKNELLQMMEDKYAELRREGKSENEAVATVISEFGNLISIRRRLSKQKKNHRVVVATNYIAAYRNHFPYLLATTIILCLSYYVTHTTSVVLL